MRAPGGSKPRLSLRSVWHGVDTFDSIYKGVSTQKKSTENGPPDRVREALPVFGGSSPEGGEEGAPVPPSEPAPGLDYTVAPGRAPGSGETLGERERYTGEQR